MSLKNLNVNRIPKLLKEKLKNNKIRLTYKKFKKNCNINENFIVAVSGGPDSMSLAFFAKIYSIEKKIKSKFYIIDHRLRKESNKEAKIVQKLLKKFLISSEIMVWKGKKPLKNIQSLARNKRYELLNAKCKELKIKNLLVGHHQDDLIENYFIRLLRGSGLKGLVSLETYAKLDNINLIRPLLNVEKKDLCYISKFVFNSYVDDPSNNNENYQRIRVRNLIKRLEGEGLNKKKLIKTINNLKSSSNSIKHYVRNNFTNNSFHFLEKNKLILSENFFQQSYEVVFRSLSDAIKIIGKRYYSARGKKLQKIIKCIKNNGSLKMTLGGCIIEKAHQTVIITKEH